MPLWAQMLIVCATFSEQLKALVCKELRCRTGLCEAGQLFLWRRLSAKSLGKRRRRVCLAAARRLWSHLCESGEVTYWLLWRLLWCCATCPSPGPVVWPVWSSHPPHWCWTASPGLCVDRWSTCKGEQIFRKWSQSSFAVFWVQTGASSNERHLQMNACRKSVIIWEIITAFTQATGGINA